jgi:hypothetical protein
MPEKPLIVWGYEASPFVQLVREKLVELETPHIFKNCARGSPKRQQVCRCVEGMCLQDAVSLFETLIAVSLSHLERDLLGCYMSLAGE